MRFVIKKSALPELVKGLNDSFEKIKAEIIAHLKKLENKEDAQDLAKATEQLNSDEYMFSHLEKSLDGEWIEKAGYGIGTVRTWRGKKYKKIAQGKWVRVYDKVDRGAKNAMTRLIHQAERIDTPEEMMKFVLANKQRFSDANGKPLDIVDRLNAVIDGKTYAGKKVDSSKVVKPGKAKKEKEVSKQTEQKLEKQSSFSLDDIKGGKKVKTVEEMENVIRQIGKEYGDSAKGGSKLIDFMSYNLEGGMTGNLYYDFFKKHGDMNYRSLLKELNGKKVSEREKHGDFADEYANIEEEKTSRFAPSKVVKPAKKSSKFEKNPYGELKKETSFSMDDIGNSEKKIKDMQQAKDIIKEIAQKDGFTRKGREKLEDFISYNIGGSSPLFDKIYSEFGVSPGDLDDDFEAAYDMILKNALGKDTSKERKKIDDSFAKQTARERKMFLDDDKKFQKEYKAEKNNSAKKEDFKSMSDEELKDYEAKLEKELLASNRSEPDYVEKYSHWQEVHQENNDRFHLHLIDEDKAEKQREEEIKAKKEKEIKEKYHGYFDNRKGLEKARAVKILEKKYRYGVKVMSNKEFVEQAIENGAEIKEHKVNKLDYPSRVRWNRMNGYEQEQYEKRIKAAGKKTVYTIDGYEFPKDVVDYARFYKEKGKSSRLKKMQKRGLSTQLKKSDSLYDYVQKSIAVLKECRAI